MGILHVNGFGTIPVSGDYANVGVASNGVTTLSRQTGRNGGYALRNTNSNTGNSDQYSSRLVFPTSLVSADFSVGLALNHRNDMAPTTGSTPSVGFLLQGPTIFTSLGTGFPNYYYAAGSNISPWTVLNSTSTGIGWHWWNLVQKYSDTVGYLRLYRDGTLLAEIAPDPISSTTYTGFVFYMGNGNSGGIQVDIGDLVIRNDATIISDTSVISLFPDGTSAAGLLGSDADSVNNHLLVNENPTYSAATYVGSATAGALDTYTVSNLPAITGTVEAVQASVRAFKSDAGVKTMATVINSTQGAAFDPGGGSSYYQVTTLDGASAWDVAKVNAATLGVKVVS